MKLALAIIAALVVMSSATAQQAQQADPQRSLESRLGATIGALIVENTRLVLALDEANKTISQLRAQAEKASKQ